MTETPLPRDLPALFGNIDIYVFDQILRGRITDRMRVLDAGCGAGRNSEYLMRVGADVYGIDADADRIEELRDVAAACDSPLPAGNFQVGRLSDLPYPDAHFDAVICCAVLHFAADEAEFEGMLSELWRVLRSGGVLFARLASSIGLEELCRSLGGRRFRLPDGTDRFLVDEPYLARVSATLGAQPLDSLKTTNVQNLRAMTTWVVSKPG